MKLKKSTYLPAVLLIYLLCMAYIGRGLLQRGEYAYYFSVFGLSLIVIVLLHFSLKKKERIRRIRETDTEAQNPDNTIDSNR